MYSKDELYEFKANPERPPILKDKLPLERKKGYSFFVGCNFIASGESVSLFRFSNGHCLTSIDTSADLLKLNVLAGLDENEPVYLIRENEFVKRRLKFTTHVRVMFTSHVHLMFTSPVDRAW